jgi:small GTP-binding protein
LKKVAEANRTHIAVIGKRNVGKSSLVNTIVNQDLSIVSDVAGTTTDPVKKSFELLPYGPVVIIDTAGIDDEGELGQKRISKTFKVLSESDFAIIVIDSRNQLDNMDIELINYLKRINISYIVVINKFTNDISPILLEELKKLNIIYFEISCKAELELMS